MRFPSGEILPWFARGIGIACCTPPSMGTVKKRGCPEGALSRPEENTIRFPSGVHPSTRSAPGCQVSRFGCPPSEGTRYTFVFPLYSALNATHLPSGDRCGCSVCPPKLVSRLADPPARGTIQMLFAYANEI